MQFTYRYVGCLCIALFAGWTANAQSTAEILGATPVAAQQCNGPLGSLLPDCQASKSSITIAPATQSGVGGGAAPSVQTPPASVTAAERESGQHTAAPEPPTEFQRFVGTSLGRSLPIFGASLFGGVPTTFAPVDRVPVTANYMVGPGDEILLRVWGQVNLDVSLPVDRAGAIFIPQAGNVHVAGIEFQQLPSFLSAQLSRVFRNFELSVNMGQLRSIQIFVVGQARRPGSYTVSSLSTLVNALFVSGGPSAEGSMRHIQLKRGSTVETEFDLYDLLLKGDKSKDVRLMPGDVVYIPPVGPQVAVGGSVKTPAIYELARECTVRELIQLAGGMSAVADVRRAVLERIKARSSRETLEFALDAAGMANSVRDGDLLRVLSITPQFENAVTLRGNVAEPGRFPWHPGMRLRDVIPDKRSLVTRDYWKNRNLLGSEQMEGGEVSSPPAKSSDRKLAVTGVETLAPDINWSYAVVERQNPRDLSTDLIPFKLGKLILEGDETQNLELRAGDVVTIFSQADIRVPISQQTRLVRLEGEFNSAGVYAVRPGETLGQLIERVGGLSPQAYLFGAEFTRESTRRDQQRRLDQTVRDMEQEVEQAATRRSGATDVSPAEAAARLEAQRRLIERLRAVQPTGRVVLNLDPDERTVAKLSKLELEDGDRFAVPARPATINVLGAVYNQNAFLHQPALRVTDYVREAGGATRTADKGRMFVIRADGSVLPRQSFSVFSRAFDATRLHPGDAIVVPEAMFKGSVMRGLRDWTQVLSQLALGAAVVNVLK